MNDSLYLQAESLQNMMVEIATGGSEKEPNFLRARLVLVNEPSIESLLPLFVKTCRNVQQFWGYIKQQSDKYEGRRQHIYAAFTP